MGWFFSWSWLGSLLQRVWVGQSGPPPWLAVSADCQLGQLELPHHMIFHSGVLTVWWSNGSKEVKAKLQNILRPRLWNLYSCHFCHIVLVKAQIQQGGDIDSTLNSRNITLQVAWSHGGILLQRPLEQQPTTTRNFVKEIDLYCVR